MKNMGMMTLTAGLGVALGGVFTVFGLGLALATLWNAVVQRGQPKVAPAAALPL